MKKNAFILSLFSIAISSITLVVVLWRVTPNSVVDLGTFIGVIAAFIGISVTLLIGYQIYNAMEIQHKLREIDHLKKQVEQANDNLEYLKNDTYNVIYEMAAKIYNMYPTEDHNSFYHMNICLKYALNLNERREYYISRINEIEKYVLALNTGNSIFNGSSEEMIKIVDKYMDWVRPVINEIKQHPNYHIIADRYDRLIQAYEARMNKIRQLIPASINDIYDDLQ